MWFSKYFFQFSLGLILVFFLEFSVGATAYVYESQVDDELLATLNVTFASSYGLDEKRTNAIDTMQQSVSVSGEKKCKICCEVIWVRSMRNCDIDYLMNYLPVQMLWSRTIRGMEK